MAPIVFLNAVPRKCDASLFYTLIPNDVPSFFSRHPERCAAQQAREGSPEMKESSVGMCGFVVVRGSFALKLPALITLIDALMLDHLSTNGGSG